jgi:preprotein translocase SecE subunit
MATAVEPSSEPRTPGAPPNLPLASLLGAIYVALALVIVFYALPVNWAKYVSPRLNNNVLDWVLWLAVLAAVVGGLAWFGRVLVGVNPPRGVHGGVFLMVSAAVAIFFLVRAVAMNVSGTPGMVVTLAVLLGLLYLAVRFFFGPRGARWMVALEEQGWFSTAQYKRSLGVKVRRLTILGVLLVGGTGVYSLWTQGALPERWVLEMPFDLKPILLLNGAKITIVLLVIGLTLWVAWRAVNVPTFSEFLIATEAEMNKVSWSTRKRLAQDTVVVLLTTLLMTLFLLVVDLFWGWLLSTREVGVLPARATGADKSNQVQEAKW